MCICSEKFLTVLCEGRSSWELSRVTEDFSSLRCGTLTARRCYIRVWMGDKGCPEWTTLVLSNVVLSMGVQTWTFMSGWRVEVDRLRVRRTWGGQRRYSERKRTET